MGAVGCSTYQETGVAFKQQNVPVSVAHCIQYIPSEVAMSGDWVVESVIGRRKAMEDAYCHGAVRISSGAGISSEVCIAGVFDGHGGDSVAKFAAKNMPARLCRQLQEQGIDNSATASALKSAFFSIDEELLRSNAAQLKGSTAVVSLITRQNVHIAACGEFSIIVHLC
jgi:protein phosphatase 2C family protein 2/3